MAGLEFGGEGYDTLIGGSGADTFVFDVSVKGAVATIDDFEAGLDVIALANTGLRSLSDVLLVNGTSAKGAGAGATILYDTSSGTVLWDGDGGGSAGAIKLGKIAPGADLSLSDFVLI